MKEIFSEDVLLKKYEAYSYGHAIEILEEAYPNEWREFKKCLAEITVTRDEIMQGGGNKSQIPKKFDTILCPLGWREIRISGDLLVKTYPRLSKDSRKFSDVPSEEHTIEGFIDGHNIDFVKNKVAVDVEWNSKDQTFDRDLLAMRTYFDCGVIDVGVIVTRSEELNDIFRELGKKVMDKYGASTTWMGKLIPRLNSRRNGGCPILAIGIKKGCVTD